MFGASPKARKMFADQFEPDGDGFLYRRSGKSAPIRVSGEERDRYIATYNGFLRYSFLALLLALFGLAIGETYLKSSGMTFPGWSDYAAVIVLCALYFAAFHWAWNAPARELRGRGAMGQARSRGETQRWMLARQSYWFLAGLALFWILVAIRRAQQPDLFSGWNPVWLAGSLILVGMALFAIFRKWRLSSREE